MEEKSQRHDVDFYNLDAIISVGYRVSSPKATKFRQWAARILPDKGRVSALQAKEKAECEYDIFNKTQHIDSDFDKQVREMFGKGK